MPTLPTLRPRSGQPQSAAQNSGTSLKASRYNVFVDRGDTVWACNTRSGAFSRLTGRQYERAKRLLEGVAARDGEEEELFRGLVRGHFLVPEKLDELKLLELRNKIARFSARGLGLIIAPTLRCNFSCPYCYVDRNANKMSLEARERVKRFFSQKLEAKTKASVCWTGGDPSLALDVVEDLSRHFLSRCEEIDADYEAVMISNGYLLDQKAVDVIERTRIQAVQVTLDGGREFHDATRSLAGGQPTFDRVLENILAASSRVVINIRINVDGRNWRSIPSLLDLLASRGLAATGVGVYFAHVQAINEHAKEHESRCLTVKDYAELEPEFLARAIDLDLRRSNRLLQRQIDTFCGANCQHHFVIDPKARLQRCYDDLGHADTQGIGYIAEDGQEIIDKEHNYLSWISWNPFEFEECRECKVLPLCMGGCSYHSIRKSQGIGPGCLRLRYNLEQIMSLLGEHLSGQRDRRSISAACCGRDGCSTL